MKKNNGDRWERNRQHWDRTLDARNLSSDFQAENFEREISLYRTRDVRDGVRFFQPLLNTWVLDLGGGLGLSSALFLRGGGNVVLCDISPRRCEIAKRKLEALGFEGKIHCVVASADAMPFRTDCFDRVWTKSVLIHVQLKKSAQELARITNPLDGRVWFIEPMRRNPFVNLYRRLLAPGEWRDITTYFSSREFNILKTAFSRKELEGKLAPILEKRPMFWLGFFASVFAFLLPNPTLYRVAETILCKVDDLLYAFFPGLKKQAWFGILCVHFPQKNLKKINQSAESRKPRS